MPPEARIAALRAEIAALAESARGPQRECLPFGLKAVDRRLAGGGLAVAALHEIAGAAPGLGDDAAATLFAAYSLSGDLRRGLALFGLANYKKLQNDFRRSPLVSDAGDADQFFGAVGVSYTF